MNDELMNEMNHREALIKRIDESFFFVVDADGQQRLNKLLDDCRAEIERLSKPYVPMAISEKVAIRKEWLTTGRGTDALISEVEAAVIKRAGLEIKHD